MEYVEYINLECVKCGSIPLIIKIVDDIAMCHRCYKEEFKTRDPAILESKKYNEWLDKCELKVTGYRYTQNGVENRVKPVETPVARGRRL